MFNLNSQNTRPRDTVRSLTGFQAPQTAQASQPQATNDFGGSAFTSLSNQMGQAPIARPKDIVRRIANDMRASGNQAMQNPLQSSQNLVMNFGPVGMAKQVKKAVPEITGPWVDGASDVVKSMRKKLNGFLMDPRVPVEQKETGGLMKLIEDLGQEKVPGSTMDTVADVIRRFGPEKPIAPVKQIQPQITHTLNLRNPGGNKPIPTRGDAGRFNGSRSAIPKDLEPLAQEARKYKSAEDFVRAKKEIFNFTDASKSPMGKSKFFGQSMDDVAEYNEPGRKLTTGLVDEKELYRGGSSTGYVETNGLMDNPHPLVERLTNGNARTPREVQNAISEGADWVDNPNIEYSVMQQIAAEDLAKKGYRGAKWLHEDDLTPVQYQIWDDSVLKTKSELTDLWEKINKLIKK